MRKYVFIVMIGALLAPASAQKGFEEPENLAQEVLNSLKNGSFKEYSQLVGTRGDILKMLKAKAKGAKHVDPYKMEKAAQLNYNNYITHIGKNFEYVYNYGKENGLNWKNVNYVGSKKVEMVETVEIPGKLLKRHRIELFFTEGDKKLKLYLTECYKFDRGWVNYGNLSWKWR